MINVVKGDERGMLKFTLINLIYYEFIMSGLIYLQMFDFLNYPDIEHITKLSIV